MHKILTILLILSTQAAFSYCQLNIRGDNICLNERALEIVINKEDDSRTYNLVTIKEIDFPNILVSVDGDSREVHIDSLSGNLTCEENPIVCKGEDVTLDKDCTGDNKDKEYNVENIYSEDMIEIKKGMFFFKKSRLVSTECIKNINLDSAN